MGFNDAEIGHFQGDQLRCHRRSVVGVDGKLRARDTLLLDRLGDHLTRQVAAFPGSNHPGHGVAAEDIKEDVAVEVIPLRRPAQLGDIPTPELIGARGE